MDIATNRFEHHYCRALLEMPTQSFAILMLMLASVLEIANKMLSCMQVCWLATYALLVAVM